MRKNTCYVIRLVAILLVISLRALGQVPEVKMVHFGVGNADCTLIVVKDYVKPVRPNQPLKTITILIDTGSISASTGQNALTLWPRIWGRIQREGGNRLDYFVISHLHEDHVGNATGILEQIESQQFPWRRDMVIIDRYAFTDTGIPVTHNGNTVTYKKWLTGKLGSKVPDEVINYDAYYRGHFNGSTYVINVFGSQVTVTLPPQRRQIFFGQDLLRIGRDYELENVQMICVASNGVIGDKEEPTRTANRPPDENDLGFAFVLRFGSFRYFTGSDLGYQSPYTNMEKPLVDQLNADWGRLNGNYPFHVCALKVNHHGSENSTGRDFVRFFNPEVAVFSSSLRRFGKSTKRHPTEEVIGRLRDPGLLPSPVADPIRFLLFTFRLYIPLPRDQGFVVDVDPMGNFRSYQFWQNGGPQDVILDVKREDDGSPFVNDKPPKIYMYKQPYLDSTTPDGPEATYSPAQVTCKRLHNNEHRNLPLPSRTY
jgi:hypothetical protein